MRTMFLVLSITWLSSGLDKDEGLERVIIGNSPAMSAEAVYVGKTEEMPFGEDFIIAIQPKLAKSGEVVVPISVREALENMRSALPSWYLHALATSNGSDECSVIVNEVDYTTVVESWFWVNWNLDIENSPVRRELHSLGIIPGFENMIMLSAVSMGFCEYIKTGDIVAGLRVIESYSGLEE
ncbi:hypothetical protein CWE15_11755 [Aliidiomarina taiwanensis]|uniref:Uncharacterized protein n=1 Tax=Aliidiomarina taiwanensis TaxID=946228 RepID=A0A432WTI4_9GAMM|nr:hypothetical protein [Aliidiomarina taiwanensis]RUO37076.1 hypothetical protein CWE15_11755 [Aliidiomarina taiwanensis]